MGELIQEEYLAIILKRDDGITETLKTEPITRCKDCYYVEQSSSNRYVCTLHNSRHAPVSLSVAVFANGFCNRGVPNE